MNYAVLIECELCGARWVVGRAPVAMAPGCPICNPSDPAHAEAAYCIQEQHAHMRESVQVASGERFIDGRIRLANPGRPC